MIPGKNETPKSEPEVAANFATLFRISMPLLDEIAITAPTIDTLPPDYFQRYYDGTDYRLYHNQNGTIIFFAGTAA